MQWKELEPDQLMDAKLKCVFEMPNSEANAENNSAGGGGGGSGGGNAIGSGSGAGSGAGSVGANISSTSADGLKCEPKLSSEDMVHKLLTLIIN